MKLPEENPGKQLQDTGARNDFLNKTLVDRATKAKQDKLDYIKLRSPCSDRKISNTVKIQLTTREKIPTNFQRLISRI